MKLFYIALGGSIGALLRYGVSGAVQSMFAGMFPWGTLAVNLAGSFLAGFLWYASDQLNIPSQMRTFLFIGILGAFTTFSTYMLETLHLVRDGELQLAVGNLLLNNVLGIMLVFAGVMLSEYLINCFK